MSDAYLTPPELAKRWHCKPSTVISKIRIGDLRAFNLAGPGCTKPRFRISPEAIAEFESRKSVVTTIKPIRRTRRDLAAVKEFV